MFLVFLNHFDALISKIIFKNKKYYEKQLQPHFQTGTPLFHLYSQVTIIIIRIIIISTTTTYHVNYSSFWFLYMCFFFLSMHSKCLFIIIFLGQDILPYYYE